MFKPGKKNGKQESQKRFPISAVDGSSSYVQAAMCALSFGVSPLLHFVCFPTPKCN